jgi:hypothetical protein
LRRYQRTDGGRGSLPSAQLLDERTQGADLDLRQRGPRRFVTEQILRFLEEIHEFLARGELHAVLQSSLVLR